MFKSSNLAETEDFNCILHKNDSLKNADQKLSSALKRMVNVFNLKDSFREKHPDAKIFSRYYSSEENGVGATRLDRIYHCGKVQVKDAKYIAVPFSDHHGLVVHTNLPNNVQQMLSPRSRLPYKAKPEVVKDPIFKEKLKESFRLWEVSKRHMNFMVWWEEVVKPGVKKLLMERGKEMNRENRGKLNLLLVQQAYLVRKLHCGNFEKIKELKLVQNDINAWYEKENEKIKIQSKMRDIIEDEKVQIYHHELHQKFIKKSSILKLESSETETVVGHDECAKLLEKSVAEILSGPPKGNPQAQDVLLQEVGKVFTDKDNEISLMKPTKEEL